MALLKLVPPDEAEGELQELYASAEQFFGAVPNSVRMFGASPSLLENQMQFVQYFMTHPALSRRLLTTIRLLVAKETASPYCEGMNAFLLVQEGVPADQVEAIKQDPEKAALDSKERAMLAFVLKAVKDPRSVDEADIDELGKLGWSEQDIFDAAAHGARATATNILFDTFKLDRD